jgi:hypothetical protein
MLVARFAKTDTDPDNWTLSSEDILRTLESWGYRGKNSRSDAMERARIMPKLGYEKYHTKPFRG